MAVNMQLSAALTRARLSLGLQWRPREENTEADQLTNEEFSGFREDQRVVLTWSSLELSVLMELVRTRTEFDLARTRQERPPKWHQSCAREMWTSHHGDGRWVLIQSPLLKVGFL